MGTNTDPYWGDQLALFEGGHTHIRVEFTMHLTGSGDTVPVGVVVQEQHTNEWIGAKVPAFVIDLRHPDAGVQQIHELLMNLQRHLAPF